MTMFVSTIGKFQKHGFTLSLNGDQIVVRPEKRVTTEIAAYVEKHHDLIRDELLERRVELEREAARLIAELHRHGGKLWLTGENPDRLVAGWPRSMPKAERLPIREPLVRLADTLPYSFWQAHTEPMPLEALAKLVFDGKEIEKDELKTVQRA